MSQQSGRIRNKRIATCGTICKRVKPFGPQVLRYNYWVRVRVSMSDSHKSCVQEHQDTPVKPNQATLINWGGYMNHFASFYSMCGLTNYDLTLQCLFFVEQFGFFYSCSSTSCVRVFNISRYNHFVVGVPLIQFRCVICLTLSNRNIFDCINRCARWIVNVYN